MARSLLGSSLTVGHRLREMWREQTGGVSALTTAGALGRPSAEHTP
jgi:hypothetical protein